MQLMFIFLFLLAIASVAGWVWLVAVGFRRSPLWGVALLLLPPVSVIVFAVKYWDEARTPFLVYAGTSVAGLLVALIAVPLMVGQATAELSASMDDALERHRQELAVTDDDDAASRSFAAAGTAPTEPVTAEGRDEPNAADTLAAVLFEEPAPVTSTGDGYEFLPDPAPSGFRSIRVGDASRFLGDYVRFVDRDGGEHEGRLKGVDGQMIVFERYLVAGTFTFEYRRNEISNLYVAY